MLFMMKGKGPGHLLFMCIELKGKGLALLFQLLMMMKLSMSIMMVMMLCHIIHGNILRKYTKSYVCTAFQQEHNNVLMIVTIIYKIASYLCFVCDIL